jgi:hypothetical protein
MQECGVDGCDSMRCAVTAHCENNIIKYIRRPLLGTEYQLWWRYVQPWRGRLDDWLADCLIGYLYMFSAPVQTGPGAHPASCTMGTESFPGVKNGRGVTLTPHPLLVPLVMKEYSYTSTPPVGRTACTEPQGLYKGAKRFGYVVGLLVGLLIWWEVGWLAS